MDKIDFIDIKQQYQAISSNIQASINAVLEHGQFILGPEVQRLEQQLQEYTQAKNIISCSSGTDALKLLLLAKDIQKGDAVLVPSFTFAATAEVVALLQATPIFVDICEDTFTISLPSLEKAFEQGKQLGLAVKGIIAVDLFGLPADYLSITEFADANNLWVIADAAQSFGASYQQKKVGTLAPMTSFSFFPSKPLGAYGDGGAIAVEDDELASKIRALRVHGTTHSRYDYDYIGLNSRLDTLQAAILIEKLKIFEQERQQRMHIAALYTTLLAGYVTTPTIPKDYQTAWALYTVVCTPTQRNEIEIRLQEAQIPYNIYYRKPLHLQAAYQYFPRASIKLKNSEMLSERVLSLPMHPYLTETQIEHICRLITKA